MPSGLIWKEPVFHSAPTTELVVDLIGTRIIDQRIVHLYILREVYRLDVRRRVLIRRWLRMSKRSNDFWKTGTLLALCGEEDELIRFIRLMSQDVVG